MMKMAANKNLTKKELQICLLLTFALCALAAVPLFVMPADWRFTAALAAARGGADVLKRREFILGGLGTSELNR